MFHIVLINPQIPPNTGNVIRLCANVGAHLHLVRPLGFSTDDKALKRAGLDYHDLTAITIHDNWELCCNSVMGQDGCSPNVYAVTTKGKRCYVDVSFSPGDVFLFGSETQGFPDRFLEQFALEHKLRIPMMPENRSLNLGNAVSVVVMEAWRQCGFYGAAE